MTRYRIEEEDDTPDFIVFLQIILAIIFLPIGIIWLIAKLVNSVKDKSKENALRDSNLHNEKMFELQNLAEIRKQGLITEEEYKIRREKILKHL